MTDIATFIAPTTTTPNAAGKTARASNGNADGGGFADILAQVRAALQDGGNDKGFDAGQIAPLQNPQLIAQLSAALTQSGDALSTADLARQLQAIAGFGEGEPVPPQFQALLDVLASGEFAQQGVDTQNESGNPADATFAALLALLQSSQSQTAPVATAQNGAQGAVAEAGLRGTLAPDAANAAAAQDATADAVGDDAAVQQLLAAARAKVDGTAKPNDENRAPVPAKGDAPAKHGAEQALDPLKTSSHHPNNTSPSIPPAGPQALPSASAPAAQQIAGNAAAPTPQAIVAGAVPAQSFVAEAHQISLTTPTTPQAAVPLEALAVHIARKFDGGTSQFEIRLHPAELGKLDISLTVADDGRVQAVVRAERAETLDILQRDARALEQQLRQAGLDVGSNALNFSLSGGDRQRHAPFQGWPGFAEADPDDAAPNAQHAASTYVAVRTRDGLDIRI